MPIYWNQFTEESKSEICRYTLQQFQNALQAKLAREQTALNLVQEQYKRTKEIKKQNEKSIQAIQSQIQSWLTEKTQKEIAIRELSLKKKNAAGSESKEAIKAIDEKIQRLKDECGVLKSSISVFTSFIEVGQELNISNPDIFEQLKRFQQIVFTTESQISECQRLLQISNLAAYVSTSNDLNPVVIYDNGNCLAFAENIFNTYLRKQSVGKEKDEEEKHQRLSAAPPAQVRFGLESSQQRHSRQQQQQQPIATPADKAPPAAAAATQPNCP